MVYAMVCSIGHRFGGVVDKADIREYGRTDVNLNTDGKLFEDLQEQTVCWMSHTYCVKNLPEGFAATAATDGCPVAAFENTEKVLWSAVSSRGGTYTSRQKCCLIYI